MSNDPYHREKQERDRERLFTEQEKETFLSISILGNIEVFIINQMMMMMMMIRNLV